MKKCKITNERGTKTVFTHAHVKWFYGQSERAYYLNYFIIIHVPRELLKCFGGSSSCDSCESCDFNPNGKRPLLLNKVSFYSRMAGTWEFSSLKHFSAVD